MLLETFTVIFPHLLLLKALFSGANCESLTESGLSELLKCLGNETIKYNYNMDINGIIEVFPANPRMLDYNGADRRLDECFCNNTWANKLLLITDSPDYEINSDDLSENSGPVGWGLEPLSSSDESSFLSRALGSTLRKNGWSALEDIRQPA